MRLIQVLSTNKTNCIAKRPLLLCILDKAHIETDAINWYLPCSGLWQLTVICVL